MKVYTGGLGQNPHKQNARNKNNKLGKSVIKQTAYVLKEIQKQLRR